jgi:ATP-dependent protease ClpP protease subunit
LFDLYQPEPRVPVPNLAGRAYVRIWNTVDQAMVDRVAETLAKAPNAEHLTIDVDSFGGEALAAFDIFVMLDRHPATRKVAFGAYVNSAAILPLMAGDERIARRGASVLLHPARGGSAEDLAWIDDQYAKIISAKTGAPIEVISKEQRTEEPSTLDWCLQNKIFTRTLN